MPPTESSAFDTEKHSVRYLHTVSEAGRLLPSASRWNSIALDYNLVPNSSTAYHSIPSNYSKSVDYNLVITDRKRFHRFIFISVSVIFLVVAAVLLVHFLPRAHKYKHQGPSVNLKFAINRALTFYDAQKSGPYPRNSPVNFRGDSGLRDGMDTAEKPKDLSGGFYDSGNNIKFTFTIAYTVTLLSWSVIEYQSKYADIGELDHVRDIIKWGSDYLLKVFNVTDGSLLILYSQVGSTIGKNNSEPNDINCWQRPEDMTYGRPVSICDSSASDLAGEIIAALSAASLVFQEDKDYSVKLVKEAQSLYDVVTLQDRSKQGKYTTVDACGKEARLFYDSSGYEDELAWGGTWLYLATGKRPYLQYATDTFKLAKSNETDSDKKVFYWNNKLSAVGVLLSRIRYFHDPGSPFEDVLIWSSNLTDFLMCSFLFNKYSSRTPSGLIILKPDDEPLLQYAATSSFLSKLYGDYLGHQEKSGASCATDVFSVDMLHDFATSQVNYILGQNPIKMSYMVGYGDKFPVQVHHRSASIPWNDGQQYSCEDGKRWLNSKDPNPQVLLGAMVGGPDLHDKFMDDRTQRNFTEPTIARNAGLVAALIALQDPPSHTSTDVKDSILGWK